MIRERVGGCCLLVNRKYRYVYKYACVKVSKCGYVCGMRNIPNLSMMVFSNGFLFFFGITCVVLIGNVTEFLRQGVTTR